MTIAQATPNNNPILSFLKYNNQGESPFNDITLAYANQAKGFFTDAIHQGFIEPNGLCFSRLQSIFNNFETNSGILLRMVYNSGSDVNDLGKFTACRDSEDTRYIVFSVNGLPMGIYLGL